MNYFSFNFVLLNISIFSICFCYIVEYECSTTVRYKRHTTSYENYINGNKERSGINSSIKYWIISAKFVLRKYRQSCQRNYYDATVSPPVCRRFAAFQVINETVLFVRHATYSVRLTWIISMFFADRRRCWEFLSKFFNFASVITWLDFFDFLTRMRY